MMQLATAFADKERFGLFMVGAIGQDPETGWLLISSGGQRRRGRPHRYWLRPPRESEWWDKSRPGFTAHNDDEALQKARVRLVKVLAA